MTILKFIGNGKARNCDSACHNATDKKCACVCGGRYHGVGSSETAKRMIVSDFKIALRAAPEAARRRIGNAIGLLESGRSLQVATPQLNP